MYLSNHELIHQGRKLLEDQTLSKENSQLIISPIRHNKYKTVRKTRRLVELALLSFVLLSLFIGNLEVTSAKRKTTGSFTEIYRDRDCTEKITQIDWGNIETSKSIVVYIRNTAPKAVTLEIITRDWKPQTAPKYLVLKWDYSGESLETNKIVKITFTLSVSNDVKNLTDFSFTIDIKGIEINTNTKK